MSKKEFEMELPVPGDLASQNFVLPDMIRPEKVCTVREPPSRVESQFKNLDGSTQYRMRVELDVPGQKAPKLWTMNNTSYKKIFAVFGKNGKAWVGKKIKLVVVKQVVRGELKDTIYGEPA
jgi:hypothetical protein